MLWARMLAYVTGTVSQELLLYNEYSVADNRILKGQIKDRLLLSEAEKATLAEIAHRLRKALEEAAAQPSQTQARRKEGTARCRERVGGLQKSYEREAA